MSTSIIATEHQEQAALIEWCRLNEGRCPALRLIFAIPNGGHRHKAVAGKLKAEGVKRGVPDLFLPVARYPWIGLFIEMKRKKDSTVSKHQKAWIWDLQKTGYRVEVCKGLDDAKRIIEEYLGGNHIAVSISRDKG